ncbi:DUF1697 domain-containing protein [candidate division WWE3 bacterium]|uniref:DUF1697 domain-containing protein n=1 Tax=candidate division WWE3 bacterium TaxID=2053526 RepID=A0A955LJV9_UNCKA|nr:DUF1697 domain-containing protein [candidate division WWE3 bacterium]
MKYVALLRGINVGGGRKVDMKILKSELEVKGYEDVSTYINSGNIFFESSKSHDVVRNDFEKLLKSEFGLDVPTLIKTRTQIEKIAKSIPSDWENDKEQKSDVAYLFEEIDNQDVVNQLPFKTEYMTVKYVKGALLWNVARDDVNKSQLSKIVGHKLYKYMTVRNVNTARYLAQNH